MTDHSAAFRANRVLWNAMTAVNRKGEFYDVEGFVAGRNSLTDPELELLLSLIHI